MILYTYTYEADDALHQWLDSCDVSDSSSVLIQIFSGIIDPGHIRKITKNILDRLPEAIIIGTTTSGEIKDGTMLDASIVISLSIFNETSFKSIHLANEDSEKMGRDAAKIIVGDDTKCVIMFADGIHCNGDAIIRGFNSASSREIIVAGGMSGDNGNFSKTYCIHGKDVFEKGLVAVSLSSPTLNVFHDYNLSWKPIGKKMTVTKSKGNLVYEVDNQPIKDVYAKYLGEDIVQKMPASTIEFPLIFNEGNVDIARSMIALPDDNGIIYAGELPEGTKVRFGIGSPKMLTDSAYKSYSLAAESPIEGIFAYSCIARKAFLGKNLESELSPLAKIAPMAGFFTYGEFFHGEDDNKLLNVTTTVLGLSETNKISEHADLKEDDFSYSSLTINALVNLVEVTMRENEQFAQELIETNQSLQLKDNALNASANGIVISDINGKIEWANEAYGKLTGYTQGESVGFNPRDLVNSKLHDKAFFESLWGTILSNKVWHGELTNRRKDGSLYEEEMTITPMTDENGKIQHFVAVKQDITERKQMEELIHKYAFYDTLTQLPNRRLLADRLTQAQAFSNRSGKHGAVLFLDLDNFKPLNDTYGHTVGDLLLVEVARRIHTCIRDSDTIARFGGDEFVVLLSELSDNEDESIKEAGIIAKKIKEALALSYFLPLQAEENDEKVIEHHCTSSIGATLFLGYAASQDEILRCADNAMYAAKDAGRNQVKFYTYNA